MDSFSGISNIKHVQVTGMLPYMCVLLQQLATALFETPILSPIARDVQSPLVGAFGVACRYIPSFPSFFTLRKFPEDGVDM